VLKLKKKQVPVSFFPEEIETLDKVAKSLRQSRSNFIAKVALEAAQEVLDNE